jgi:hypothetical protein
VAVRSSSGKLFYVNQTGTDEYKRQKADLLENINNVIKRMIILLKQSKHKDDPDVKKLFTNWSGFIEELHQYERRSIFAYNVNKGESISLCLENKNDETLNDINALLHVVLHELAHVMTEDYKHDKHFWDNFEFLRRFANENGLYVMKDYGKNPVSFCHSFLK